jgi:hypothetical protein
MGVLESGCSRFTLDFPAELTIRVLEASYKFRFPR